MASISLAETALIKAFAAIEADADQMTRFAKFAKIGLPHPRAENWRWTDLHGGIAHTLKQADLVFGQNESITLTAQPKTEYRPTKTDAISLLAAGLASAKTIASFVIETSPTKTLELISKSNNLLNASVAQVLVKSGCSVVIIEENQQAAAGLAVDSREFIVEPGASLTRILLNKSAPKQTRINQCFVEVGEGGSYNQFTLDFGGFVSRNETHITLVGAKTNITLNGVYLLAKSTKSDMTSVIDHQHQGGISKQLVKGVVLDQAKAVFQGKFYVAQAAQKTDATMGHHTILLSDMAKIQSKPELEIYADDVACAHGNTTGTLDESAIFYMRQRGLPEAKARTLLIRAFVMETLNTLPNDIAKMVAVDIDNWLEAEQ